MLRCSLSGATSLASTGTVTGWPTTSRAQSSWAIGPIGASLTNFEPFSEDHEYLSTTLIGESEILKIDQDGRVILTDSLKEHAGITDRVTFVGQGYKFQIWEPDRFIAYREEAKARLRDIRKRLLSDHRASGVNTGTGK